MAPAPEVALLAERAYICPSGYYASGGTCYANSSWNFWGRWGFTGVILVVVGLLLIALCVRARRRRSRGLSPMYGTGWMAGGQHKYGDQNQPPYQPPGQNYNYGNPPPQYSQQPQYTGQTFNSADGYHGANSYGQNNGIPLQQPANVYTPNGPGGYEPPPGPPPSKIA